jgi:DNA-directed RNA polymerase specialized sigma24 family protein
MSADRQGRLDVQELERHNEAIRRLARGLVAGDDAADEVVQRTLVVALEAAPKDPSRPLAWLYGVMKTVVRTIRRGESRRERREAVAAKPEAVPSVLEDAAEIDARLRLWAHVRRSASRTGP